MKPFKFSLIMFLLSPLLGCSSNYGPYDDIGGFPLGGYTDTRINANTAIINFDANHFTSLGTVKGYALYRCAQVTIENGYDYFIITSTSASPINVNVKTSTVTHPVTNPPRFYAGDTYQTVNYRSSRYSLTSTQEYATTNQNKHGVTVVIKMFKGRPNSSNAYDANDVIAHLGPSTF